MTNVNKKKIEKKESGAEKEKGVRQEDLVLFKGLKEFLEKEGIKDYESLPDEWKAQIERGVSPDFVERVKAEMPDFDLFPIDKEIKKYFIRCRFDGCNEWIDLRDLTFNKEKDIICPRKHANLFKAQQMAKWLMSIYDFEYITDRQTLYVYDEGEGVFIDKGEEIVGKELNRINPNFMTTHVVNEALNYIIRDRGESLDEFTIGVVKEIEDDLLINLKNGVYSVKGKKLLPHEAKYRFLAILPYGYNPDAKPDAIIQFFMDVSKDMSGKPHWDRFISLFEYAAWIFMPRNNFQKMVLFWGEGSNGKGTVQDVYRALVGKDLWCKVSLYQLSDRFSSAKLFNKILNTAGEVNYDKPLENTDRIKEVSGEDPITFEFKGKTPFDRVWEGKCFFNANKFPKTTDNTEAFYRRWQIQMFENKFSAELGNVDSNLPKKLTKENEISGLFNLIVEVFLPILMRREGFTFSQNLQIIADWYERKSDSVKVFLRDRVMEDPDGKISKPDMRKAYEDFCKKEGLLMESDRAFKQALDNSGLRYGDGQINLVRYWKGIRLKDTDENPEEKEPDIESIPEDWNEFKKFYLGKQREESNNTFNRVKNKGVSNFDEENNTFNTFNTFFTFFSKNFDNNNNIEILASIGKKPVNPVNPVIDEVNTPSPSPATLFSSLKASLYNEASAGELFLAPSTDDGVDPTPLSPDSPAGDGEDTPDTNAITTIKQPTKPLNDAVATILWDAKEGQPRPTLTQSLIDQGYDPKEIDKVLDLMLEKEDLRIAPKGNLKLTSYYTDGDGNIQ